MALLTSKLDKSTPVPLYYQLKELVQEAISNGEYPVGSTIPTEQELSQAFGISRTTVRQAITELVREGRLYREKSKGTFVAEPKINQDFMQRLESFNEQIRRSGHRPWTELLEKSVCCPPQEVAEALGLGPEEQTVCIYRRRYADDDPIVTVKTYVPYAQCPELLEQDWTQCSLYECLDRNERTKIRYVQRRVEAVMATESDAQLLHIDAGMPVLHFTTVGFTAQQRPMEFSKARYRGDRSSFDVTIFRDVGI